MPIEQNSIKSELYEFLKSQGLKVTRLDSSGKVVPVSDDAEVFQFHWHKDDQDYGTVSVSLDGLQRLTVYFNQEVADSPSDDADGDSSWTTFLKRLKKFSKNRQLSFNLDNTDNLGDEMKKRERVKRDELKEGWTGNKHTSYSDSLKETVKIVLKHNKRMEETDQRYRHIDTIFVETSGGERFKLPTKKTSEARAFARHIAEGGMPNDDRWSHIKQLCEERGKLSRFVRATKSGQFNESVTRLVTEATQYYHNIGETIKTISGSRGYDKYFESWTPTLMEDDSDVDNLSEMFTTSKLDERIAEALPILKRFGNISEMAEIDTFESWADSIIDETLYEELKPNSRRQEQQLLDLIGNDSDFIAVGPDGSNAIGLLHDVIEDEALYSELRAASEADPDNDARPIIVAWMEQHADDIVYAKVLSTLDTDEVDEPAEPEDEAPPPEAPPQDNNQSELPDLGAPEGDQGAEAAPQPPLEEDELLGRLRKLSGVGR